MILNQKKDFEYNNNNIKKNDFPEYDTINNSIDFVYNYKNQYNNHYLTGNNFQRKSNFYN